LKTPQLPRITQPRNTIALTIKVSAILFATLAIFHQDLIILANEAVQSELMTHILAIPFLLIYLLYRKIKTLRATISFETTNPTKKPTYIPQLIGALLCLTAFLLYWHGSYTFTPLEYHIFSLPIFITGLILILFNTHTLRALAFPITFLFFLTPPPLEIIYALGTNLSTISSEAAHTILKTIGLPVTLAEQYGTPVITLQNSNSPPLTFAIDIACAGIYSLIGFTIFAVFVTYIAKGKPWKKAITFLIGFPLIYLLNILRITTIVLIGNQYGMQTATQAFHLLGGWTLIFLGTLLLLTISEKLLKIQPFTQKSNISTCPKCSQNPQEQETFCHACGKLLKNKAPKLAKQDLLKIAAILLAVGIIVSIQAPVFALSEGPAEVLLQSPTGQQKVSKILPEMPGYVARFINRDMQFEETAGQDAALTYAYTPTTNKTTETIWVTLELAKSKSKLHRWEACLITYPTRVGHSPRVIQLDLRDIQLLENPPLIARYFAFQQKQSNHTQVVLYWYENAQFQTNTTSQQEYVKISLITFPNNPTNIQQTEQKLYPVAKAIANHWQPIKTWSQIALTISQNGPALIAITTTLLLIPLTSQAVENWRTKNSNQKAYHKLNPHDQQILKATHHTHKPATTQNIATTYQTLTDQTIPLKSLHQKLEQAQQLGLIKKEISNQEDQPIQTWKTQIPF
jgi:exosortase